MQSLMSLIVKMNKSKLKRKGYPKSLSDIEQKKSRSRLHRKVAVEEI